MQVQCMTQAMPNFGFILILRIVKQHMPKTESLTRALQAKATDILQGVEYVSILTKILSDARCHIGIQFRATVYLHV